jgi:hypothetical protein
MPPITATGSLDEVKPAVDSWIQQRGTSMDGESYVAALQLAAYIKALLRADPAPAATAPAALTALDADMVWPAYDGETFFHTIDDAVQYEIDQAWPTDGPLELKLQLAKRIPIATVRIFNITENGNEWEIVANSPGKRNGDDLATNPSNSADAGEGS